MHKRIALQFLSLLAAAFACVFAEVPTAVAYTEPQVCGSEPVTARGEASRYIWLARTKARANWRRKVRSITALGPDYAVWGRAVNTEERCLEGPAGTVCIFTGTPCR